MTTQVGTFVRVSTLDGSIDAQPFEHDAIRKAFAAWRLAGKEAVLCVASIAGNLHDIAASRICTITLLTPENRADRHAINRALDAEAKTLY